MIESPSTERVYVVLAGLPGGADSFAILSGADGAFVQALGSAADGFLLEHRASGGELRRAANHALKLSTVARAFERFRTTQADPLDRLAVAPLSAVSEDRPRFGRWYLWLPTGFVLLALVAWIVIGGTSGWRVLTVGMGSLMAVMLRQGVQSGRLHGYSRSENPGFYQMYVVIYSANVFVSLLAALLL